MATATERLQLLITANGAQAVSEMGKVGNASARDLGRAERNAAAVGTSMISMGSRAAAGGAVAVAAMYSAAQQAQGLADSVDKAEGVFGSARGLEGYAERAVDSMALSKEAALDAASAYGLLLSQSGVGGSALANASTSLAERTADLAEKYKKPYEEVQKAIESVIKTGSSRALRGLLGVGIEIDPAALQGLDTASRTTKLYNEILLQTADAQGTVAASGDDIGVRAARAQAKLDNALADFGESAIPVLIKLADAGAKVLDIYEAMPEPIRDIIGATATLAAVGATLGGAGSVLGGGLLKAIPGLKGIKAEMSGVTGVAGKLGAGIGAVNPYALALTATVGAGLGIYDAWATNAHRVDEEMKSLAETITNVTSGAEVLPALANQFNQILESRGGGADTFKLTGLSVNEVIEAISAAPGAFDQFRDSVDGLGGSLDNLDGIAESLRGGGIDGVREQAEKAPAPVRRLLNELLDLYEAGGVNADQLRQVVDYITDLDKAAGASVSSVADQANALLEVAPAAVRAAGAWQLYKTATDGTAGAEAQAEALARLKELLPEATARAGLAAGAMGALGNESAAGATGVVSMADALDRVRSGADGAVGEFASAVGSVASAVDSVDSAKDRLNAANKALADLTTKDAKTIESAYERVISAKERLDDILRGDDNNLEQESPEATIARARARLAEANTLLAANPQNATAQTDKDEALADIERGIQRRQDMLRNAEDTARQVRDAERAVSEAQEAYQEALAPPDPEALKAAQDAVTDAQIGVQTALLTFAGQVLDGKISVEEYAKYLDTLVAQGIISPEASQSLTDNMNQITAAAGLAAAALGRVADTVASKYTPEQWANYGGGALRDMPASFTPTPMDMFGRWPTIAGAPVTARASGGHFGPGEVLVGENGPEIATFPTAGYVVNATRSAGMGNNTSSVISGVSIGKLEITEARDARETGRQVVKNMRRMARKGR